MLHLFLALKVTKINNFASNMFILVGMIVSKERFLSEEVEEVFGKNKLRYGILSGPSFAQEILELHPTIVVVASRDAEVFLINYSFFDVFSSILGSKVRSRNFVI